MVLVLNNCTDRTHQRARAAAREISGLRVEIVEVDLPPSDAHVGTARRMAMDRALSFCPPQGGVILTTDADAAPDGAWIDANLSAIAKGADLVGGKLSGNRQEEERLGAGFLARAATAARYAAGCDRLAALIDPIPHDPWPRHADHTGGSLAIRAEVYRAVGGLPPLPRREDLALVSAVRAWGGRLVHPLDVRVEVSARVVGRARGGMADCLKDWVRAEAEGRPLLVEDPVRVEARLLRRRAIRALAALPEPSRAGAASRLGLDIEGSDIASGTLGPGWFVERFAPDMPDAEADTPVAEALARLIVLIAHHEGASRAA